MARDDDRDDVNPYAAPAADTSGASRAKAKGDLAHSHLKYVYLASLLAPVALTMMTLVFPSMLSLFGLLQLIVVGVAMYAFLAWVSRTWALVPERLRVGVSPGAAVGSFFIPIYNFWWSFAVSSRIARAIEETLAKYSTRVRAPTMLAWVAPLLPLASLALVVLAFMTRSQSPATVAGAPTPPSMLTLFLPFVALAPFVTYAWMSRVDTCNEEILFLRAEKRARKERRARDE